MVGIIVNPPPVIIGRGVSKQLAGLVDTGTFYIVHGSSDARHLHLLAPALRRSKGVGCFRIPSEPDVSIVDEVAEDVRETKAELVVAVGGGSVMDAAKAAAALATNPGLAVDYLEEVGNGRLLVNDPLPVVAVPTTFGTGSEVTDCAFLRVRERQLKAVMRDERMVPRHALVDANIGAGMSEVVAAATGFAAMTRVCEAFVCREPCLEQDFVCEEGIAEGFEVIASGTPFRAEESRRVMAMLGTHGGMMAMRAKLGAADAFAVVISGMTGSPFSAVCAALFAEVFRTNIKAIGDRVGYGLDRYATIAEILTDKREPKDLPDRIEELHSQRELPRLREFGIAPRHHGIIAEEARKEPSMKGNPIDLSDSELTGILERSM